MMDDDRLALAPILVENLGASLVMIVLMCFLALLEVCEDACEGWSPTPACAGKRRREVMPKADALSSKPRREVFQDENTEAMTASLQFATPKRMRGGWRKRQWWRGMWFQRPQDVPSVRLQRAISKYLLDVRLPADGTANLSRGKLEFLSLPPPLNAPFACRQKYLLRARALWSCSITEV
jgi:hypothetical protein